jgi:hypothetical protein
MNLTIDSTSLDSFIQQLLPHTPEIRQALYQYSDVVKQVIKDLETPLKDGIPNDIKVFHNGQLQKWFEYEPHNNRYFVKAVPNFQLVPLSEQIYVHYYFDGVLAMFGVYQKVLLKRITTEQQNLILSILK